VNFDKFIGQLSKDWEWLSFVTRYCAGRNIDTPLCEDFMGWALAAAALVVVVLAWWILARIAKAYERWKHRSMLAKVADAKTMNKYRWSGHDLPEALSPSDQRAAKARKSEKS
jgi:hypothetical protein